KIIGRVVAVGEEAADFSEGTVGVDGWETVASSQRYDLRPVHVQEGLRHHDQATTRLACLRGNGGFELGHIVNGCCDRLHPEGLSGGSEGIQVIFGKWRGCRVEQEGDPPDARGNLLKQLQPLAGHRRFHSNETGYIAAWPRQTRDEATANWIDDVGENDGDGPRLLHHRQGSWCVLRKN